jgi:hypothetical protein
MQFWSSLLQSTAPQSVATEYLRQLSGLPDGYKNQWIGTRYSSAQTDKYRPEVLIHGRYETRVATNMVERTVSAYLAIEVFGKGDRVNAQTWDGTEGWDRIYNPRGGVVICTGVCNYLPGSSLSAIPFERPLP